MNRSIILLSTFFTFLMFTSFVTSIPFLSKHEDDPLSGFKECKEDNFPDTITAYDYSPNPIEVGQPITVHIAGEATEPIVEGSELLIDGFLDNEKAFNETADFCQVFVAPTSKCPVKDHFDITTSYPTQV